MEDVCEGKDFSFPKQEEKILAYWSSIKAFETQLKRTEGLPEYVFYDGPPFATGLPHYGHILAGTIKDIVTRYQTMIGHHVTRRFGWDCHGVPVEHEIDKKLGIETKDQVLRMGIDKYNEECRSIVTRYVDEWEKVITRTGRWIDFKNGYKTMDLKYMESVWWVFSQLYHKGLVYRGFKVMPYSTALKTPLSNFEANLNYKDVADPEIMVSFPITGDEDGASLVAWTTTPWTLPSNLCLCVNSGFVYVKVRSQKSGTVYIVAESRLSELPTEKPKGTGAKHGVFNASSSSPNTKVRSIEKGKNSLGYTVLEKIKGSSLVGKKYRPLFDYFIDLQNSAFRVVADDYVTADNGTGIVHCAPAFGEDDYRVCVENGVIDRDETLVVSVDDDGHFTPRVSDFEGCYVKDADRKIIEAVREKGRLVKSGTLTHSYPFCWRSDTPLIYRAVPSWFIAVEKIKDQLLENNRKTYWVPDFVREKRFHNWLENAKDWAVSRTRFWGTPLPVWTSDDGEETVVVDSVAKLELLSGERITDLHRHRIDHIVVPSSRGDRTSILRRVDDVFDCWFESGAMPYAYIHYPFENVELFEENFPGHFVAEGLDQTRGWFYTLMVLSTALFEKPAFHNLICNGLILADDGKKMSKKLRNYPPPAELMDEHGADALRLYIINSPVVRAEPLRFRKDGVHGVVRDVFLPWYNAYRFLVQNARKLERESGERFGTGPAGPENVLDRWIGSATRSLVRFVRAEMDAYRLYTVVPRLLGFLDGLTNVYVRFSRGRLKGRTGPVDCRTALLTLHRVLVTSCTAMAPFTPFFAESLYQNLRRVLPGSEESVHYRAFPDVPGVVDGDERIERSVERMMRVIDIARSIRERHGRPLKMPLRSMIVVHPDRGFLDDITGRLKEFVLDELNVRQVVPCDDVLKHASVRAEPEFSVLGKRLGRSMAAVAKGVRGLTESEVVDFEVSGEVVVEGHRLRSGDLKVVRSFRKPATEGEEKVDADGDGDVLVVVDLGEDRSLVVAGLAREFVNRVQKLRKKAGLEPTDAVEIYVAGDGDLSGYQGYVKEVVGSGLLPASSFPSNAVILCQEIAVADAIILARPVVVLDRGSVTCLCGGDERAVGWLETYLVSRDWSCLRREAVEGGGKVMVRCVEGLPPVELTIGEHLFLTFGDFFDSRVCLPS